jgi:hypothetical protein
MASSKLPGQTVRTDLGDGYVLHSATLAGDARAEQPGATRSFGGGAFDAELARAGLELDKVVVLPPPAAGTRELAAAAPTATLEVPVGDDESCILLVEDASGAVSWVLPDVPRKSTGKSRALGAKASLRFTIPLDAAPAAGATRGLKDIGKKINSFLFKLVDPLLGPIIHGFARKWETKNRPTFTRAFGVDDYQIDDPNFARITDTDWRRLSQGRALLFVHGTFSTSGAFASLSPEVMAELSNRYGGRMFAFNHATLTADPRENAIAFLGDVPEGMNLEVDIVCHSRGGLVSRQIALLGESRGVRVRRIVFVGAVNAGTALADDEHMIGMIDRFTTIAKFIPQGTAKKVLDALVLVVKVVGHGLLTDLEGLAAMNPRGPFLEAMNVPGGAAPEYFAIASDFEPKAGTPLFSLTRAKDLAADKVFEDAANDLVVPRDGVFSSNGAGGFPIEEARCLKFGRADGIVHTEFFAEPRVGTQLLAWLEPAAAVTRAFGAAPSVDEVARILDVYRDQVLTTIASMSGGARGRDRKSQDLTPEELEALRPHVVNLSEGVFKSSGKYSTNEGDVDAIVREHIPKWAAKLPANEPLRIAIWAHGGLIGERDGLRIALKHVEWWQKNGVYPIYFVWETGLFDALRSILESVARKIPGLGARDLFDFTTDPLVQEGVRALGGAHVWGAMKNNAALASGAKGGARYTAKRLLELVGNPALIGPRPLEFHAVGHSAGSIFHSWFLPMAKDEKLPRFKTLQLLAPAITVADFDARLTQQVGANGAVEKAVMYTMKKSFEEDDDCIRVYRKSLLYLIHHALESQRRTPILGLEISLRAAPSVAALFGLNGTPNAPGRVVWSVTKDGGGNSSSASTTHGGFDDDVPTMNGVAANVLNAPDARVPYQASATRSMDGWPISDEWLDGVDLTRMGAPAPRPQVSLAGGLAAPVATVADAAAATGVIAAASPRPKPAASFGKSGGGARRALSVGIDAYPDPNALSGCANDSREWSKMLVAAGFETPRTLINEQATHLAIVTALRELVVTAKRGDVLVFHYSGHGTEVADLDGDEGPDGSRNDQAFVPVDFEDGAFLIDDDIRDIFEKIPAGVSLTAFIDCCHSGTITRMLGRNSETNGNLKNARFLKRTGAWEDWMRAHERFRDRANATRATLSGSRTLVTRNDIRWVNFSACRSTEKALEHGGIGDFTRHMTPLLKGDLSRFTPRTLHDEVVAAFGEGRLQTPQLDCPDVALNSPLFQPLD